MTLSMGTAGQLAMLHTDTARLNRMKMQVEQAEPGKADLVDGVDPRMRMAAEGFEALFLNQMLQAGRSASLGDDLMGGTGTERMQSMLDQALTEGASSRTNLGLADAILRQLAPYGQKATD